MTTSTAEARLIIMFIEWLGNHDDTLRNPRKRFDLDESRWIDHAHDGQFSAFTGIQ